MFYSVKILVLIFEKYFSSELKIMSNNLFCEKQGVLSTEVSILRLCFKIVLFNHYNCNCFVKINSFKRVKKVFKLVLRWGLVGALWVKTWGGAILKNWTFFKSWKQHSVNFEHQLKSVLAWSWNYLVIAQKVLFSGGIINLYYNTKSFI